MSWYTPGKTGNGYSTMLLSILWPAPHWAGTTQCEGRPPQGRLTAVPIGLQWYPRRWFVHAHVPVLAAQRGCL